MSETDIADFADDLMRELGYGDNPYRIFRHDDTGRTHYHVVSTRIGQDGLKVSDSFENRRCEITCRTLAAKYGYIYGLQEEDLGKDDTQQQDIHIEDPIHNVVEEEIRHETPARDKKTQKADVEPPRKEKRKASPPFSTASKVPAVEQYKNFHMEAIQWYFSTPEQYAAILRWRYNTKVDIKEDYNEELTYTGLGRDGKPATPPVGEKSLGLDALGDILKKCDSSDMRKRKAQRKRLEDLAVWAAEHSDSWRQFRSLMAEKGIYTVISWTKDGEPFGVTWLDRATKCAWKGSETSADLTWLKDIAQEKGWKMERDKRHERPSIKTTRNAAEAGKVKHVPLSEYGSEASMKSLMRRHGTATHTQRSNEDASKNRDGIKYGREDDNDIVI